MSSYLHFGLIALNNLKLFNLFALQRDLEKYRECEHQYGNNNVDTFWIRRKYLKFFKTKNVFDAYIYLQAEAREGVTLNQILCCSLTILLYCYFYIVQVFSEIITLISEIIIHNVMMKNRQICCYGQNNILYLF